jgi:hypothetical protein
VWEEWRVGVIGWKKAGINYDERRWAGRTFGGRFSEEKTGLWENIWRTGG